MKIPKQIKVASHTYRVIFKKNLIRNMGNRGSTNWHLKTIEIDDDMGEGLTPTTFLHEIIHVVDRHFLNDQLDEDNSQRLAEGLLQVFTEMGVTFEK